MGKSLDEYRHEKKQQGQTDYDRRPGDRTGLSLR